MKGGNRARWGGINRGGGRADDGGMETLAPIAQPAATEEVEAGDGSERRAAHRQAVLLSGMLYRDNGMAGPQRVKVKNASLLGVGFESAKQVEPGTRCRLLVEAGPARLEWRLRVVCCGKIDGGGYYVGGQFLTNELDPSGPAENDPSSAEPLYILQ